jgi:hypothetical protein
MDERERKHTNVLCYKDKYELCYKGNDAYDLLLFFAQNIINYCKCSVQKKFDPKDKKDKFYMQQAKNIAMSYHLILKGELVSNPEDTNLLRTCIYYSSRRFKSEEFLSLIPHNLDIKGGFDVDSIANKIVKYLKSRGFIVHKRISTSSVSRYLMIDNRVLKLIRISDHESELPYKYNVIYCSSIRDSHIDRSNPANVRYILGKDGRDSITPQSSVINILISDILADKEEKIEEWGRNQYNKMVHNNETQAAQRHYVKV